MKRILLLLSIFIAGASAFAYTHIQEDSAVVKGVLSNGLTYYIRHNDFLPNRASFFIAQKVGSIQEKPEQYGLAHFLEHMAFNGTKHYPEKNLTNYLQVLGVKFGHNINAYTSVDETVYRIEDVPTERTSAVDSSLLILRDWSDGILLKGEAIDNERGVIEEEWRVRNNAWYRLVENHGTYIYGDDKYAHCLPIGSMDVVRNCSYETLREYYRTWYRPDLQGIIIVGDIDVKKTEDSVKRMFSDVKMPKDARERIYYSVTDYEEPRILICTDPEMPKSVIIFYQKVKSIEETYRDTEESYKEQLVASFAASMLEERLSDITKEPQSPFATTSVEYDDFINSKWQKSLKVEVIASNEGAEAAFTRLMTEVERMRRLGVTEVELERVKNSYLAYVEQMYTQKNQQTNDYYAQQYISNFLSNTYIPSLDTFYELAYKIASQLTVADINAWLNSWDINNKLIICSGVEESELPTKEYVQNFLSVLPNIELQSYEDMQLPETIIPEEVAPKAGKILRKKSVSNGAVEYKLSNGVEVYFKQTDFKDDEITFSAKSLGGMVMADSTDWMNARLADKVYSLGGLGTMNSMQLGKFLSNKRVSLGATIDIYTEELQGTATKKDVEYLFQLLYASFTAVKEDLGAYQLFKENIESEFRHRDNLPYAALYDTLSNVIYGYNPLCKQPSVKDIEELDYSRSVEIFKERFANAADFKFTIVGSIDEATLEPFLEKYVASLPANKTREKVKRGELLYLPGEKIVRYNKQMHVPATMVALHNFVKTNSSTDKIIYPMLQDVLDLVYTKKVRQEQGGTYGVQVQMIMKQYPCDNAVLLIEFSTDASKVDVLVPIIHEELKRIAEEGPSEVDMQKVKEHLRKTFSEQQRNNYYWNSRLQYIQLNGKDLDANYLKNIDKISAKDIQKAAQSFLKSKNQKEVVQVGIANE